MIEDSQVEPAKASGVGDHVGLLHSLDNCMIAPAFDVENGGLRDGGICRGFGGSNQHRAWRSSRRRHTLRHQRHRPTYSRSISFWDWLPAPAAIRTLAARSLACAPRPPWRCHVGFVVLRLFAAVAHE